MYITINEDATFLITDELGDIPEGEELGFYSDDARFLSCYQLTLDGQHPLLLSARSTGYDAAKHFLTNPALPGVDRGQLTLTRERHLSRGLREDLLLANHSGATAMLTLEFVFAADFASIFEVKRAVEGQHAPQERAAEVSWMAPSDRQSLVFSCEREGLLHVARIAFSAPPTTLGKRSCTFALSLAAHEEWRLSVVVRPHSEGSSVSLPVVQVPAPSPSPSAADEQPPDDESEPSPAAGARISSALGGLLPATLRARRARREATARAMLAAAPALDTDSYVLSRAYEQSMNDFVALRIKGEELGAGEYTLAAGIPWFMALFGRDSLIAAYQALPFLPETAKGVLRALARLQGTRVDPLRAEEPGKILHEYRYGELAIRGGVLPFPYYGSIDATPLFLVLLAAVYRATGDLDFVRSLRAHALDALSWIERYGDRDGDGYLEYILEHTRGLDNQGWKDSWDAIRFRDGRVAEPPIALCEAQGYVYAAWLGMSEVFEALGERERSVRLRAQAVALKERFERDFWLPDRHYYALALDGAKRPVTGLTSNPGHLLWTGIADAEKARQIARRLVSPELFSGWGIRTMGASEGGYNPISYHCGSVWPHDNSLIVAGLARYGFVAEAAKVASGLLTTLSFYPDYRLPELLAGYSAREAAFPVEYPTANRPQAWASGAVLLMLSAMAGLDVGHRGLRCSPFLPDGVEGVELDGIWIDRHQTSVEVRRRSRGGVVARVADVPLRQRFGRDGR